MSEPETKISNNNELAIQRTDLAQTRTDLAAERNVLAQTRTDLARERTRAAQERTLMAWIRTSLSMVSFGFGIDRFFSYLNKTSPGDFLELLGSGKDFGVKFNEFRYLCLSYFFGDSLAHS